jgi:WD40 repeat protein
MRRPAILFLIIGLFLGTRNAYGQASPEIIGTGVFSKAIWLPDDQTLIVGGARGIWVYDAESLESPPQLIETPWVEQVVVGGNTLAVGHRGGLITLWNITSPLKERDRLEATGTLAAISGDGTRLATAKDGVLTVRDVTTGETVDTIRYSEGGSWTTLDFGAFSYDGTRLLYVISYQSCDAAGGGTGIIWDVENHEQIMEIQGIDTSVGEVAFSPNGMYVVTTDFQGMSLLDLESKIRYELTTEEVNSPAFSADSKTLTVFQINEEMGLRQWDVKSRQKGELLPLEPLWKAFPNSLIYPRALQFSNRFAALLDTETQLIPVWRLDTGNVGVIRGEKPIVNKFRFVSSSPATFTLLRDYGLPVERQDGPSITIASTPSEISPDGSLIAWRTDGTIFVQEVKEGSEPRQLDKKYNASDYQLDRVDFAFSPDSQFLAVTLLEDPVIDIWELATGKVVHQLDLDGRVQDLTFTSTYLAANINYQLYLWDTETWKQHVISIPSDATDIPPDFMLLGEYELSKDKAVTVSSPVWGVDPCYADIYPANTGIDMLAVVYTASLTDSEFKAIATLQYQPASLAISPDGTIVVIGDVQGALHVIDLQTGEELNTLDAQQKPNFLAFDESGEFLAAAGSGGFVIIWRGVK